MPRQITPFNQAADQQFTDLLVYLNPGVVPVLSKLALGDPVVVEDPQITLSVTLGTGYRGVTNLGSVNVSYSRLSLATYFQGVSPQLSMANGTDDATLLGELLDRYMLYFTTSTSDPVVPHSQVSFDVDTGADPPQVTLTVGAHHLFWEGSVVFELTS